MTKQKIFDKVLLHARTQKQQAIEKDCCRYRTKDGLKCFIGALIPDDKYDPSFEGSPLFYVNPKEVFFIRFNKIVNTIGVDYTYENLIFLSDLQRIHDFFQIEEWEKRFQSFAEKHDLIYTSPDNKS